ncbi:glycoside hydrolase family 3 C-terminal domain-containing protein [Dactylosporangium sp. CS-033363]|uniref:glycoside hydrolase family 3 C-terminal domain-containing protein n=1 Tax=Dactylosporangium sp. CS-033363 TaxID=3239935 RepID=UPI003D8EE819
MPSVRRALLAAGVAAALTAGLLAGVRAAEAADQPWRDASQTPAQRADELLAAMTQAEKLTMLHGGAGCGFAGCVDANTRLGIPQIRLQDGPVGAGDGFTGVTQLPAPVASAATWDVGLARQYGEVLGSEQWGKGTNVVLAPTINIVRDPRWGRAFESFGEDPYLAGQIGAADIQGIQSQGPMAQVKHYAAYNQETNRNTLADNAIVNARTQREIYLPAFETAVQQGQADSAMCSYSAVNGAFACENGPLQNDVLKRDLGFTGFITSDWGATHSTVASANNGLDMEMPGSQYFGAALTTAVQNGQVSQATIDDHVRRILLSMFRRGLFDKTQTVNTGAVVTTTAHADVARQVARDGAVLLKNAGNALPLAGGSTVAVIGPGGGTRAMVQGGGSAAVNAPYLVTPFDAIHARSASAVYAPGIPAADGALPPVPASAVTGLSAEYHNSADLTGPAVLTRAESTIDKVWGGASPAPGVNATNWSARYTGTLHPTVTGTYQFSLTSDDGSRLLVNGQQVINNWFNQGSTTRTGSVALTAGQNVSLEVDYYQGGGASNLTLGWAVPGQSVHDQAIAAARGAGTALVFVDNFESEGSDLAGIDLSAAQNQLVADVAAANPNTVVVVNSGSAVTMPWLGSVKAVVEAWYPGQEDGNALAALLYGDANFTGKLPVTFPARLADVPANTAAQWPGQNGQVQYSEGLKVGYRWYDAQNVTPLFPFGHGLSYTTFAYANLTVGAPDTGGKVAVAFDVTNTGQRAGSEVPQVYVGQPAAAGEPPRNLRGFTKVSLAAGQTQRVTVTLDARSFQTWGTAWTTTAGTHQIAVGSSSRDLRLTGQVTIGTTTPAETPLPRTGWTVTASSTGGADVPARTIDGNTATRWSSGVPMANGQWLQADLGSAQTFDRLRMDSAGSANDYARGYQILTSANGTTWSSPIATGTGTGAQITATFPAQTARYVRVVQTGTSTSWWSVAELNLDTAGTVTQPTGPLSRTGWTATASATGGTDVPARVLDGDTATRWSTGTPMAGGQWLQLDLGAARTFKELRMDSAGSAADYARGYQILTSADGTTWSSPIATGTGTGALVTATFPTQTVRYVRIVQTGTSTSWWSVAELNLYA